MLVLNMDRNTMRDKPFSNHIELRQAATNDPEIMRKIRHVCESVLALENPENFNRNLYASWLSWTQEMKPSLKHSKKTPEGQQGKPLTTCGGRLGPYLAIVSPNHSKTGAKSISSDNE